MGMDVIGLSVRVVDGSTRTAQKTVYWIKMEKKCFVILVHVYSEVCTSYTILFQVCVTMKSRTCSCSSMRILDIHNNINLVLLCSS